MLERLKLRFGPAPGEPPLEFAPGAMTVFVGPNNSGKSVALREIEPIPHQGWNGTSTIVERVHLDTLTPEQGGRLAATLKRHLMRRRGVYELHDPRDPLVNRIVDEATVDGLANGQTGIDVFARFFTTRLDGMSRLGLLQPQQSESLNHPQSMLGRLLVRDDQRNHVRKTILDAFPGRHFVIDLTSMQSFHPKLSAEAPPVGIELSVDEEAREFFARAIPVEQFSDGVRAFAGIVTALLATEFRLVLIDEPEAFLHPPLSRKLGRFVAELAREREGNVIAATHSADFLYGAVTSGVPVNIVRLTWDGSVATARLMPASEIATITRDPFMRTARVLDAVFHRGAVVCEADADRAFYDEINARLGVAQDVLFLNANGKDSLARIVGPLRRFGIPAAAIADLDLIENGTFKSLLAACNVPPATMNGMTTLRAQVQKRYEAMGQRAKSAGITGLTTSARAEAQDLIDQLASYGIFLVPVGELERWLPKVAGKGAWLQRAFESMPATGDGEVWDFMRRVAAWIHDPNRRGMPLSVESAA